MKIHLKNGEQLTNQPDLVEEKQIVSPLIGFSCVERLRLCETCAPTGLCWYRATIYHHTLAN